MIAFVTPKYLAQAEAGPDWLGRAPSQNYDRLFSYRVPFHLQHANPIYPLQSSGSIEQVCFSAPHFRKSSHTPSALHNFATLFSHFIDPT
jgi:hypothetical protein